MLEEIYMFFKMFTCKRSSIALGKFTVTVGQVWYDLRHWLENFTIFVVTIWAQMHLKVIIPWLEANGEIWKTTNLYPKFSKVGRVIGVAYQSSPTWLSRILNVLVNWSIFYLSFENWIGFFCWLSRLACSYSQRLIWCGILVFMTCHVAPNVRWHPL